MYSIKVTWHLEVGPPTFVDLKECWNDGAAAAAAVLRAGAVFPAANVDFAAIVGAGGGGHHDEASRPRCGCGDASE